MDDRLSSRLDGATRRPAPEPAGAFVGVVRRRRRVRRARLAAPVVGVAAIALALVLARPGAPHADSEPAPRPAPEMAEGPDMAPTLAALNALSRGPGELVLPAAHPAPRTEPPLRAGTRLTAPEAAALLDRL